jgi:hypothetical protein
MAELTTGTPLMFSQMPIQRMWCKRKTSALSKKYR